MVFMGSLASSIFPMAIRHSAPARIFPMAIRRSAPPLSVASLPRRPGQLLPDGYPPQRRQSLRLSALASNKPHPAEKGTPVWLAIWHIWAGFANSQHRDATFATPKNICAHSSLLPHWAAAQTLVNLSAHLHRLPTPPPYLRQMRLLHGRVRRCWVLDDAATWSGAEFEKITAHTSKT